MSNIKRMIRRADVTEVLHAMLTAAKDESEKEYIARVWQQIKEIPVVDIEYGAVMDGEKVTTVEEIRS